MSKLTENVASLFIPGPVDVAKPVLKAQSKPMVNHRGKDFPQLFSRVHENLQKIYLTDCQKSESKVFILTCSGTGAVEAMLVNLVEPTDRVLCIANGAFGDRIPTSAGFWAQNVLGLQFPWGSAPDLQKVSEAISNFKPTIVAMVHNDTSTGVCNPVKQVAKLASDLGALTLVDSVSGLGGSEFKFDEWGVDACASASQKCLGGTPGAGFVALSPRAWKKVSSRRVVPSFYFDLRKYDKFFSDSNQPPFTPAESVYFGLDLALQKYLEKGVEHQVRRHKSAAALVRKSLAAKGYSLFAQKGFESSTLTTFKTNDAPALRQKLLEKGFEISAGMGDYKQTVGRIGHMGSFSKAKLKALLDLV